MPSILRLPCVMSNGICNRATGDRQNRATATGPPGAGLRDRTPTTPNAVRRGNKTPPGSNFRWAARKRGERTLLPSAAGWRTSPAPALPGRRAVRGAPGDAQPGRAAGNRSAGGTSGVRATASVPACGGTRVSAESGQFSRWGRGARLTRRVREEYRVYFDRNATQSAAKRRCLGGMDRRSNAAWVPPPAGKPARDGSEFPDSDISGFPRPPAGRDGGAPDSAGAWRTSGRARSPAVVHSQIRQVSKIRFRNQVRFRKSGARGHPRGHPRGH